MKRIVISILSILLFFNSSLFIIIYSLKTLEIAQNTKSNIQHLRSDEFCDNEISQEITVFKTTANDTCSGQKIRRVNDDEIIYNGYYFDIICEKAADDTLFIFCVQDYEEDEMLRALIVHCEKQEDRNKELQYFNILFLFLSNVIYQNYSYEFPLNIEQCVSARDSILNCTKLIDIPDPPPRFMV